MHAHTPTRKCEDARTHARMHARTYEPTHARRHTHIDSLEIYKGVVGLWVGMGLSGSVGRWSVWVRPGGRDGVCKVVHDS